MGVEATGYRSAVDVMIMRCRETVKCLVGFRNDLAPNRRAPPPPTSRKPGTTHVDTTDSAPPPTGQPKMSHVIGQLRRAPPPTTTTNDGEYCSIDLVRTAGARAWSNEVDGGGDAGQQGHVYGPLSMNSQRSQETDSTYAEIGMQ